MVSSYFKANYFVLARAPMRRSRRAILKKEPLNRATGVGLTLPSFNFVERPSLRTPKKAPSSNQSPGGLPKLRQGTTEAPDGIPIPQSAAEKAVDFDEILYFTIGKWATQMHEPSLCVVLC